MKTSDFNYDLPEHLIAQTPLLRRDNSRLLILGKNTGKITHKHFNDIVDYINEKDVLVVNNTKVMPARLIGLKEATKAVIELLLLKNIEGDVWECLVKPQRRVKEGTIIHFSDILTATCTCVKEEGISIFEFSYNGIFYEILDKLGEMPLPPYIHEKLKDKDRYQTIYAKNIGSAAAPTAGLHFTDEVLNKLKDKNVEILEITLHVGLGTFRPVKVEDVSSHHMHKELYEMSEEVANKLNAAIKDKRRIIAVGTTSVRTLESIYNKYNKFIPCHEETDIFIYPGYNFKVVHNLITNFHLPESTLIMLISALAGKENILNAYKEAVRLEYRFFSFGDSMFISDNE